MIGSGLAALGTVLGLLTDPARRVGVVCGPADGRFCYYDERRSTPCAYLGPGGLGSHWHGVVPTRAGRTGEAGVDACFDELFERFHAGAGLRERWGTPGMFVPWRPVRPARELQALAAAPGSRLTLLPQTASALGFDARGATVACGAVHHRAQRVWVAAGALHTPGLLAPLCPQASRPTVSDHAFVYIGQVDGMRHAAPRRTAGGVVHAAAYDAAGTALYSLRPARFAYRQLDHGIEQRVVFGMPTGSAIRKIARRLSPGLLSEALYNRFGWWPDARTQSVYAQVRVPDAYEFDPGRSALVPRPAAIRRATDAARAAQPYTGLRPSQRPDIHLPGIHLHGTLDRAALQRAGIDLDDSPLRVVDAAALADIGADHHSFRMMARACERARRAPPA